MSAAPGPGRIEEQKPVEVALPSPTGVGAMLGALAVIPIVFLFIFHLGAGYLSYQKYGSMAWAVLDFFFAYFYYPYYAFVLNAPTAPQPMFGGKRSVLNLFKMKW